MQSEHAACAEIIASLRSEVEALKVCSQKAWGAFYMYRGIK